MKQALLFLCLILFACSSDNASKEDTDSNVPGLSSSSEGYVPGLSSSSSEAGSSSSEERWIPCKPYLSKISKNTFNFNEQGGVDTADIGGTSIRISRYDSDIFSDMYNNKECDFFLTDHYTYGENFSTIKVESDYCKNNYCNDLGGLASGSPYNVAIMKIDCHWFSVAHISKDSVQVSVNKNETGKERSSYIPLTGGGCALSIVDSLKITQGK
jgi:hypothetical protein